MALVRLVRWLLGKRLLPDFLLRPVVRYMLGRFLRGQYSLKAEEQTMRRMQLVKALKAMPIFEKPHELRDMYETPAEYFTYLGKGLKLSCLYFHKDSSTLDEAEDAMLELYCQRANIKDGQSILDIGGGFGSVAFYIADKFPSCKITTLSYAKVHKDFIDNRCRERGIKNIEALDVDVATFESKDKYDRVFAIQVLEHMKNFRAMFKKISAWLKPDGRLFAEVCCHRLFAYHQAEDPTSSLTFGSGEIVPSDILLLYFQEDLSVCEHYRISGMQHAKTCDAWLKSMDSNASTMISVLGGDINAQKSFNEARVYLTVWGEMFRYRNGEEWMVSHYLFKKKA